MSPYGQTQARPRSSLTLTFIRLIIFLTRQGDLRSCEVKGRQLRFLGHSWHFTATGRIMLSTHSSCIVCPICKETKCWRTETFVFTIHLKGSDGARNTTRYRRPGLLSRRHLIAACRDNPDWDDQTSLFLSTCLAHPIKTTQVRFSLFNVLTTFSWTSLSSSAVVIAQTSYSHNRPRHF